MTKTTGQRIVETWRVRHHGPGVVGPHDVELQIDIDQALETANAEVTRLTKAIESIRDCRFMWELASNASTLQQIAREALDKKE